ncbi:hypothetical protein FRC12_010302, partial [Ceratobasidium sp. 428]
LIASLGGNAPPTRPFLIFYSDVVDGQMWCPDCRNVEQVVKRAFDRDDGPTGIIRWVGNRADWKSPSNVYRRDYGVSSVPTIVRLKDVISWPVPGCVCSTDGLLGKGRCALGRPRDSRFRQAQGVP